MSNDKPKLNILIIKKPNLFVSLIEDIFTFGGFMALLWFNHAYLAGNGWIDFTFIMLWISMALSMQSRRNVKVDNVDDGIKWLEGKR